MTFLKVAVNNSNGNVKYVYWKQFEPSVSISDYTGLKSFWTTSATKNKFIFDGVTTMDSSSLYLETSYAYQKLRMSTFNYYKDTDIFRIVAKCENTRGEKGLDIIEFGINDAPKS